jgi:hypothetical protein
MSPSPLYVRPSPALRELVASAGSVTDAVRALLLIGAAAAGLDVAGVEGDAGRLLAADLDPRVAVALRRAFFGSEGASAPASYTASAPASTPAEAPLITLEELDSRPAGDDEELDVGYSF